MVDKPDPFDVQALETAVNDSATRVSAIWISFLIFSLYLLVAATTVTQHQLLLAQPVQLPVLNIGLPLWGFFFLAPCLFVILHVYVLLQVLLLGRTAAAYNAAVVRLNLSSDESNSLRQRLSNTLFAQIFAGAPRERAGFIGSFLSTMVWITLVILPVSVLLTFQFNFLAYHSHAVTWMHRLLISIELVAFILLWPVALDGNRDFRCPNPVAYFKNFIALPWRLFAPQERRRAELLWLRRQAAPLTTLLFFIIVPLLLFSFPGEPHVNAFTLNSLSSIQCHRWLHQQFDVADLRFDRLVLSSNEFVDGSKLDEITKENALISRLPTAQRVERQWTQNFQGRNLECSDLEHADLRGVNLIGAHLQGANLQSADLKGASLSDAELQGGTLAYAQLQGVLMDGAHLVGAQLKSARLQGANLYNAVLEGADLTDAWLQGAFLKEIKLRGAILDRAQFQGASLNGSELDGASLKEAQLQGTVLGTLDHADMSGAWVWRASIASCPLVRLDHRRTDQIIEQEVSPFNGSNFQQIDMNKADEVKSFVISSTATIPNDLKNNAVTRMSTALSVDQSGGEMNRLPKVLSDCEPGTGIMSQEHQQQFDADRVKLLLNLGCNSPSLDPEAVAAMINNWIGAVSSPPTSFSVQLARGLLGTEATPCSTTTYATKYLSGETKHRLTEIAQSTPRVFSPSSAPTKTPPTTDPASAAPDPARATGSPPAAALVVPTSDAAAAANQ